ncbi:MAG: hypothetical protein JSR31_13570 [Nitrospira sp.]|nr:hypothetical protein [Nitrospira sp.]
MTRILSTKAAASEAVRFFAFSGFLNVEPLLETSTQSADVCSALLGEELHEHKLLKINHRTATAF